MYNFRISVLYLLFYKKLHVTPLRVWAYISISISNWPPCPSSIIVFGWFIYNPEAEARGELGSVPNIVFATVSSHIFSLSPSLFEYILYPPSVRSVSQAAFRTPSSSHHHLAITDPGHRSDTRHRSIMVMGSMNCVTVLWWHET